MDKKRIILILRILLANNILKEGRRSLGDITDAEAEVTKPVKRLESIVIN